MSEYTNPDLRQIPSMAALAEALESGATSAEDLVDEALQNIAARNDRLGAFTTVLSEDARRLAAESDGRRRRGAALGPFDGIPYAAKDNIDVAGVATTAGSLTRKHAVAAQNAAVVDRLAAAGFICVGKTVTTEFAMEPYGTNMHFGTARNPWSESVHRLPGGSSAGSAVAVASGMVPMALGTDTGGSVRLPAAWNGLVGLRPSLGSVPMDGVVPLSTALDIVGPLTRRVDDAVQVHRILSDIDGFQETRSAEKPRLLRLGSTELDDVDASVVQAYEECCARLAGEGIAVEPLRAEIRFRDTAGKSGFISTTEGYCLYGHLLETARNEMDPGVVARLDAAPEIRAVDYCDALWSRDPSREAHLRDWRGADCLLTPVARTVAPAFSGKAPAESPSAFLRPVGYLGLCSIVVPTVCDDEGMPIGIQVVGRPGGESVICEVARRIERLYAPFE